MVDSPRIVVLPADETGCGSFRMRYPTGVVREARPDWQIEMYRPSAIQIAVNMHGDVTAVQGIGDPSTIDLIVIQRVGLPGPTKFLRWVRNQGGAVIVDADDAMWCIDRDNIAWKAWNGASMHWKWLDTAADDADLVTVTTDTLARRYGKHGRVEILPNRIPASVCALDSARGQFDDTPTVGWMGFTGTHPGDLRVVGDAVSRALADTGARARVVGDAGGAARDWGLTTEQVDGLGPFKLGPDLYRGLSTIDVGLVPLRDSLFNRSKSSLKALEFSAVGVPVIATPTPANRLLAKDVPILLAASPAEWYEHMVRLLRDPDERAQRGSDAREAVARSWTMEANAHLWVSAWERAINRRRRLAATG